MLRIIEHLPFEIKHLLDEMVEHDRRDQELADAKEKNAHGQLR